MKKKLLLILLSAIMAFTMMPLAAFADDAKKLDFTYTVSYTWKEFSDSCYYTDSYFDRSAKNFNLSLASMSFALATSAFKSHQELQYANVKDLMLKIGIPENKIKWNNDFETLGRRDNSYGVIVGSKPMDDCTLVIVSGRGSGYESEWASNFKLGKVGDHAGFNEAKKIAMNFLKQYIQDEGITGKVKFWVTGYSRSAAASNLIAAALDRKELSRNLTYSNRDVFCYTFESPACAAKTSLPKLSLYNNIFNIVNPNDGVVYFAPSTLGFTRYGIDKKLPVSGSVMNEMIDQYNNLPENQSVYAEEYMINDFAMQRFVLDKDLGYMKPNVFNRETQSSFVSRFVPAVGKEVFKNRCFYTNNYQDVVMDIFAYVENYSQGTDNSFESYLQNEILRNAEILKKLFATDETKALKKIAAILNNTFKYVGGNYEEVKYTSKEVKLLAGVLKYGLPHINDLMSVIANIDTLRQGHYPQIIFSFLKMWDKNYGGTGIAHFSK